MDLISKCFQENDGAFLEQLKAAGFSTDQARRFLPASESYFLDFTQDKGVEQITQQLVSDSPAQFLNSVNADAIAKKLGMDSDLVKKGLAAIVPLLAQTFSRKSEGLIGAVTSIAPGLVKRFS